jgi:serine/threonine-protein kinase
VVKGKLPYMAPEQVGSGRIDPRSDIFSAGVVLYQCLTLQNPFRRDNDFQTMQAVLGAEVVPVSALRSDVPRGTDAVVNQALARRVEDRFQSAAAFRDSLEQVLVADGRLVGATEAARFLNELLAECESRGERLTQDFGSGSDTRSTRTLT